MIGDRPIRLQVDGGVAPGTIGAIAEAGADTFVAGSAIYKGGTQDSYEPISRPCGLPHRVKKA